MKTDNVQYVPVMQYIPKAVKANATDIAQSFPRHQVEVTRKIHQNLHTPYYFSQHTG